MQVIADHFVPHVSINNLDSDHSPELIAESITDTAITLRSEKHDFTIFNIKPQNNHLKTKAKEVNTHLARLYKGKKFSLIDHAKRIKPTHINRS